MSEIYSLGVLFNHNRERYNVETVLYYNPTTKDIIYPQFFLDTDVAENLIQTNKKLTIFQLPKYLKAYLQMHYNINDFSEIDNLKKVIQKNTEVAIDKPCTVLIKQEKEKVQLITTFQNVEKKNFHIDSNNVTVFNYHAIFGYVIQLEKPKTEGYIKIITNSSIQIDKHNGNEGQNIIFNVDNMYIENQDKSLSYLHDSNLNENDIRIQLESALSDYYITNNLFGEIVDKYFKSKAPLYKNKIEKRGKNTLSILYDTFLNELKDKKKIKAMLFNSDLTNVDIYIAIHELISENCPENLQVYEDRFNKTFNKFK